jgi:hypothetical protein
MWCVVEDYCQFNTTIKDGVLDPLSVNETIDIVGFYNKYYSAFDL